MNSSARYMDMATHYLTRLKNYFLVWSDALVIKKEEVGQPK